MFDTAVSIFCYGCYVKYRCNNLGAAGNNPTTPIVGELVKINFFFSHGENSVHSF